MTAGISGYAEYEGQIKAGKLRPLASFGGKRSKALPDVPTLKELGFPVVKGDPFGAM